MTVRWNCRRAVLSLAAVIVAGSCARSPAPEAAPAVALIRVVPSSVSVAAGQVVQLSAEADDVAGQPVGGTAFHFAVSDPKLLAVSPHGLLSARGPLGEAAVVVTGDGRQTRLPVHVVAGAPAVLVAAGGDGQEGAVGSALPEAIMVRALDAENNPVADVPISFAPADGGIVDPASVASNGRGEAATRWTLGPVAGAQSLTARLTGSKVPSVAFTAHAESGPPAHIRPLQEGRIRAAPGEDVPLHVQLTDAEGNPKANVPVRWIVKAGAGRAKSATSTTDERGVAQVVFTAGRRGINHVLAVAGDLTASLEILAAQ